MGIINSVASFIVDVPVLTPVTTDHDGSGTVSLSPGVEKGKEP